MREFLRHGSTVLVGTLGANVLFYLAYALVQRGVGVEQAGLFMALLGVTQLVCIPAAVSSTVVAKFVADACAVGERGAVRAAGVAASRLTVGAGVVSTLIVAIFGRGLERYFHAGTLVPIAGAAAVVTFFIALAPQRAVFQGSRLFGPFVISNIIEAGGKAAVGCALILIPAEAGRALLGFAGATAAAFAYNVLRTLREPADASHLLPRVQFRRHVVGIALPIAALSAVTFADGILVRHYLSARDSGLYAVTTLIGRALVTVTQFVPTVLLPHAVTAVTQRRSPLPPLIASAAATTAIVAPVVAIVWRFPTVVIGVIGGAAFNSAAPLVLPYAVAMTALASATVLATYLIAVERRGFVIPLVTVALLEIGGIVAFHANVEQVVRVVLIGHVAGFVCCAADTVLSVVSPRVSADLQS